MHSSEINSPPPPHERNQDILLGAGGGLDLPPSPTNFQWISKLLQIMEMHMHSSEIHT